MRAEREDELHAAFGVFHGLSSYPSASASGVTRSWAVRSARSGVTVMKPSWHSRASDPGRVVSLPWLRLHPEGRARPAALEGRAQAAHLGGGAGGEVDVIEDAVGRLGPGGAREKAAADLGPVLARRGEGVVAVAGRGAVVLRQRDGAHPVQGRFHRPAHGAGVERVLGDVVAAVDAREDEIGRIARQHLADPGQNAIGRRALDGEAPVAEPLEPHRPDVGHAMGHARLLEHGRDHPDLAGGAGELGRDLLRDGEPGCGDAVVVRDQNAHAGSLAAPRLGPGVRRRLFPRLLQPSAQVNVPRPAGTGRGGPAPVLRTGRRRR